MKAQRKGSNDKALANLAEHKRRMDQYVSDGFSRNEASRRALLDMESVTEDCAVSPNAEDR